jgi:Tfp pilus assembly protein PilF
MAILELEPGNDFATEALARLEALLGPIGDERIDSDAFEILLQAMVAYREDDTEQAVSLCTYAIANDPSMRPAYEFRAELYFNLGDYDLAVDDLTTSLDLALTETERDELAYSLPDLYYNRGLAYLNNGDLSLARDDFEDAIDLAGDDRNLVEKYNIALDLVEDAELGKG